MEFLPIVQRDDSDSPPPLPRYSREMTDKYIYFIACSQDHTDSSDPCSLIIWRYNKLSHMWNKLSVSAKGNPQPDQQCIQRVLGDSHIISFPPSLNANLLTLSGLDYGKQLPLTETYINHPPAHLLAYFHSIANPDRRNELFNVYFPSRCCWTGLGLGRICIDVENRSLTEEWVAEYEMNPIGVVRYDNLALVSGVIYMFPEYCEDHENGSLPMKVVYKLDTEDNSWSNMQTQPADCKEQWPGNEFVVLGSWQGCIYGLSSDASPDGLLREVWSLNLTTAKWTFVRRCSPKEEDDIRGWWTSSYFGGTEIGACYGFVKSHTSSNGETTTINKMIRTWFKPPPLEWTATERMLTLNPNLIRQPPRKLLQQGVPRDMVERLVDEAVYRDDILDYVHKPNIFGICNALNYSYKVKLF